jgi:hypothetical protein
VIFFIHSNIRSGESEFSHQLYDSLLQKYVNEAGLVDYAAIKDSSILLDRYLNRLKNLNPEDFEKWSRDEKMAFWINAYNAITIKGIIRNYPIEYGNLISRIRFPRNSIRQISGFWEKIFIPIMGKQISLDQIEHQILRKKFNDPRIHAALVCAAISCPHLDNHAFSAQKLDQQLEAASRDFVNNPEKVRLNQEENKLHLSSIFDWYKTDFKASEKTQQELQEYDYDLRGVIKFVLEYLPEDEVQYIKKNKPEINFLDYDWTLNEQN